VNPVFLVARREVRERIKARSFRIATLISAAVVIAAIAIPASQRGHTPTYDVAVTTSSPAGASDAIKALAPTLKVHLNMHAVPTATDGGRGLRTGEYDVVINNGVILTKRAPDSGDTGKKAQLIAAISNLVRLQRLGPEAAAALQTPVEVRGVLPPDANSKDRFTAFVGVLLLFVFLQQYGTWVLMGVVEEKASRVVEVLLSAIRPRQLVAGKVIGIGAVAIVQGAIVALSAIVASTATGTHIFEGTSRFAILWILGWFALGYSFYALLYASVGSLVSRQADAQNAAFPVGLPILVGYFTASTLLSGSDPSLFARVLSYLPPTAPMVMPMLIGIGRASALQAFVSMALLIAATVAMARVAGAIYARAVLHTGQRLRLRQVLRRDFNAA